ncbi:conserved hypothetical protein [Talaromyces stipitatus ATCC 10500]|uniref:Uncharacterized protein n=1 Tax=Talaromyces stipitatus (strain ATCC 10500 / CBS 375.48 / QM 6759 / NRRL 1006) TaxID=441959 RepID=B8LYD6_TALSN|nr:uncharacterized protein TSTA_063450 [Talaromyces stipitatus ATCC 10500]EED22865.1 conserved hypothetical protein [Talaromyces stipitatus ATCC 10500]
MRIKAAMMSSRLPRILRGTALSPQARFVAANIRNRQQVIARRSYAEAADNNVHERRKGNFPWLVLSVAITVPAAWYLWSSGPKETSQGAGPKRPAVKGPEEGRQVSGEKQSERDPAHAIKPEGNIGENSGAQTSKQQGVSNDDTMNPYLNAPGKGEKPEGVTDSSKLKGTVSPER